MAGGANENYTWVYMGTGIGNLNFSANVTGGYTRRRSGDRLKRDNGNVVSNVPILAAAISTIPNAVSLNQNFTVIMTVTNTGLVDAANVTAADLGVGALGTEAVKQGIVTPASQAINAGQHGYFTWIYKANTTGVITLTSTASSTTGPVTSNIATGTVTSYTLPDLSVAHMDIIGPVTYSVGQSVTVIMTVSNIGQTTAINTAANMELTRLGTTAVTLLSGPVPASATIVGSGGVAVFTFTYRADTAGTLGFNGNATGYDVRTGIAYNSGLDSTDMVTVVMPATLTSAISVVGTGKHNINQVITVIMTVTNSGTAAANNVNGNAMYKTSGSTGGVIPQTVASVVGTIGSGASASFTWTYLAVGNGNVTFSGNASGTDANSSAVVSSPMTLSTTELIQSAAVLTGSLTAVNTYVGTGAYITVVMNVNNTGEATANAVTPDPVGISDLTRVTLVSGTPASVTLAGATSGQFTWVYQAVAQTAGIVFTTTARGTDANNAAAINTGSKTTASVQIYNSASVNLTSIVITPAGTISTGQNYTVVMAVANNGLGTAINVAPSAAAVVGAGSTIISGPLPAGGQTINAAGTQNFTWVYRADAAGTVSYNSSVVGTDQASSTALSAGPATSNSITVVGAASLVADSITASPSEITVGQQIQVVMQVSNIGTANAEMVLPVTPTAAGAVVVTSASPVTITGGTSASFTWVYNTTTTGAKTFSTYAAGVDANSRIAKSTVGIISSAVTVQSAPVLAAVIGAVPSTVKQIVDDITVVLNVTNSGEAQANTVVPVLSAYNVSGATVANYVSGPTPVSAPLAGGANVNYTWVYRGTGIGQLGFSANVTGADIHTAAVAAADSNAIVENVVSNAPILTAGLSTMPNAVSLNQNFTVIMTVTNIGLVDAANVTAADLGVGALGTEAVKQGIVTPASQAINAGQHGYFTWIYKANTTGVITLTSTASSTTGPVTSNIATGTVTSYTLPDLSVAHMDIIGPVTYSVGQSVTVIMTVSNIGQTTAINTAANMELTRLGTTAVTLLSGPVPASATIVGSGGVAVFTFTYRADTAGTLGFNGNATGYDVRTGIAYNSGLDSTDMVTVVMPATLTSAISVVGTGKHNINQVITVIMTVTNSGTAAANNVNGNAMYKTSGSTGGVIPQTVASVVGTIGSGASASFTWTYLAVGNGNVTFSGNASGTDANSSAVVSSPMTLSTTELIQSAAVLTGSLTAVNTYVGTGAYITVVMNVNNTGEATANAVTPDPVGISDLTRVTLVSGTPASVTLAGATSGQFTWVYQAVAQTAGIVFTTTARGTDANNAAAINTGSKTTASVQIYNSASVNLTSIVITPAGTISTGQNYTVVMAVANNGLGTAINVAPSAAAVVGAGSTIISGPLPAGGQTINAAGTQNFTWVYRADAAGTVSYNSSVVGTDQASSTALSAGPATSNSITVVGAASLVADSITASPSEITVGQQIQVVMQVSNIGTANAEMVLPVTPTAAGAVVVTSASPVTITGGTSASFTWVYNTTTTGAKTFSTYAAGVDANSRIAKSTVGIISSAVTVQSAPVLAAVIGAVPSTVKQIVDDITVVLNVTNSGEAQANTVVPVLSAYNVSGATVANYVSGPTPVSAPLAGGANVNYTWVYRGTGIGQLGFSANVTGADIHTAAVAAADSNAIVENVVSNAPILTAGLSTMPNAVSLNQNFTVIMTVTNIGLVDAANVTAFDLGVGALGTEAVKQGIVTPASQAINAGQHGYFTWIYKANTTGVITLTSTASSTTGPVTSNIATGTVTSYTLPDLSVAHMDIIGPVTYSVGQSVTVIMTVSNIGQTTAINTAANMELTRLGTTAVTLLSGPVPASATIVGSGGVAVFTFTYRADTAGTLGFNGNATGYDVRTGIAYNSGLDSTDMVTVVMPATLTSAISVVGTGKHNINQVITVIMTVTNSGTAAANNVNGNAMYKTSGSTGGVIPQTAASVVGTIGSGASASFTWTYLAVGNGNVTFSGNASGTDANSSAVVSSPMTLSTTELIQSAAVLTGSLSAVNTYVGTGAYITVVMNVNNTGEATANAVTPDPVGISDLTRVTLVSGTPASVTLAGATSGQFTWVYQAVAQTAGIVFTTTARGTDANNAAAINTGSKTTASVQIYNSASVNLTSIVITPAGTISTGQNYTVVMAVANNGLGTAINVAPSAAAVVGAASTIISGPLPAGGQTINAAGTQNFTWVYRADAAGTVSYNSSVVGTDQASSTALSAGPATSNSITVVGAASLVADSITATPSEITVGQQIQVVMQVSNIGTANAEMVLPVTPTASGAVVVTSASPVTITGGTSASFTWVYNTTTTGAKTFSTYAVGVDANSRIAKSTVGIISSAVTVQSAPVLAAVIGAVPSTVKQIVDDITVVLNVTNSGEAQANNVVPVLSAYNVSGATVANYVSGPTPVSAPLAGGANVNYTWVYRGTGIGQLGFSANVTGADIHTAAVAAADSNAIVENVVSNAPILTAGLSTMPNAVSLNQNFTVIMTVTNIGLVDAANVTAFDLGVGALGTEAIKQGIVTPATQAINAGQHGYFTWIYKANTTGVITLTSTASSTTGPVTSNIATGTVTSYTLPDLSVAHLTFTTAGPFSVGQSVTVVMSASNTGATDAINAAVNVPLTRLGTSSVTLLSGPVPASATIAGSNGVANFTFVYRADTAGDLGFNGNVTGYDVRTGLPYTSALISTASNVTVVMPATLTSAISILGTGKHNISQTITVIMTVTNTGTAAAQNVNGNAVYITSGSTGGAIQQTTSSIVGSIASGASASFTWTYLAVGSGNVTFSVNASGTDANSGAVVSSPMTLSSTELIQSAASLTASMVSLNTNVGTGANITVVMNVNNTGEATANAVAPDTVGISDFVKVGLISGPVPVSLTLTSGMGGSFTWVYSAVSSTAAPLSFTTTARGKDANTGATINSGSKDTTASLTTIYNSASVNVSPISILPAGPISTGQNYTVLLTVSNNGQGIATNVAPSGAIQNGAASTLISGPTPGTYATLNAGTANTFQWIYRADAAGVVSFNASVTGTDQLSLTGLTSGPAVSNNVTVVNAAALAINSISVTPAEITVGQQLTIVMNVANNGTASADAVLPVTPTAAGSAVVGIVTPATPQNIGGGANQDYTWIFATSGAGNETFSSYAVGYDTYSKITKTTTGSVTSAAAIQTAPAFTAVISAVPATVRQVMDNITVVLNVTNNGQAQATNVTPGINAYTVAVTTANLVSAPIPASKTIAGGATESYTWIYTGSGVGTLGFSANVTGTDAHTAGAVPAVNSNAVNVNVVANTPLLSAALSMMPNAVSLNQNFTVIMTVTNTGLVDAANVTAADLGVGALGTEAIKQGVVTPASQAINSLQHGYFTWIYKANTTGVITLTGTASSTTGPVTSNIATGTVTSYTLPNLTRTYLDIIGPVTYSQGQYVTVVMTVSNTGETTLANTAPNEPLTRMGIATATQIGSVVPASAAISGNGGVASFTFVYRADTTGSLGFNGGATGYDTRTGIGYSSPLVNSAPPINVVAPAALASAISVLGSGYHNVNQIMTVIMTVTNTGATAANNVNGNAMYILSGSTGGVIQQSTPAIAGSIASGSSANFTWTYLAAGTGNIVFSSNASGTDVNSGFTVSSAMSNSSIQRIQAPANLAGSIAVSTTYLGTGANITLTMNVTNTGVAGAASVVPDPVIVTNVSGGAVTLLTAAPVATGLAGGDSAVFTWVYRTDSAGTLNFRTTGRGTDVNELTPINTGLKISADVVIYASGSVNISSIAITPAGTISTGQQFTVIMYAANSGQGTAINVQPSGDVLVGSSATKISGPVPAVAPSIASLGSQEFTWIYTANSAGSVAFSSSIIGTDFASLSPLAAGPALSNVVLVANAANLTANSIGVLPSEITAGQQLTVIMSVVNSGDVTAEMVLAVTPTAAGTAAGSVSLVSSAAPVNIPGGSSNQDYTWIYNTTGSGIVTFSSHAVGYDFYSKITKTTTGIITLPAAIQTEPALTAVLGAIPSTVRQVMDDITVVVNVANGGEAQAVNVAASISAYNTSGATVANYVSGPSPLTMPLSGGSNGNFTWVYRGTGVGQLGFSVNVKGADVHTSTVYAVNSNAANVDVVSNTPILAADLSSAPATISNGQYFTVIMTVTNTGLVDAAVVTAADPGINPAAGSATKIGSVQPASQAINAGNHGYFTWIYRANTTGVITLTGSAASTTGPVVSNAPSTTVTAQTVPDLTLSHYNITGPATYSVGQYITAVMTVSNTGETTAVNVTPNMPQTRLGSALITLIGAPSPASATLPGSGGVATFTFVYRADTDGTIGFNGNVTGSDIRTGLPYSSTLKSTQSVTVITPAALTSSISVIGTGRHNMSQTVTVVMTVTNTGASVANNVNGNALYTTAASTGGAIQLTTPALAGSIASGASASFTWEYLAAGTGSVIFSGNASGVDALSGFPAVSAMSLSQAQLIQSPAALSASISVSPAFVGTGAAVTVAMNIKNTGEAGALNVLPDAVIVTNVSGGSVTLVSAAPVSVTLTGGASTVFTWIYSADSAGTLNFRTTGRANDANEATAINSGLKISSDVEIYASGSVNINSIAITPAGTVSVGQQFTVILTAVNNGQGTAVNVQPSAWSASGAASTRNSGPLPATLASLATLATQEFTWIYTADAPGAIVFNSSLTGTDQISLTALSAGSAASNTITIVNAANLVANTISAAPAEVTLGQPVTVVLNISNNGGATAEMVLPVTPTASGPVTIDVPATPADIAAGANQDYTWTFITTNSGFINFSSHAIGYDFYSKATKTTVDITTNVINVQTPAAITAVITALPATVKELNDIITVVMSVSNSGQSTANNVMATVTGYGTGIVANYLSGPVPVNATITAGSTSTFTWTFTGIGLGVLNFSGNAAGIDKHTSSLTSSDTNIAVVNVVSNSPVLTADMSIMPANVAVGQELTIILTVTNVGLVDASSATPPAFTITTGVTQISGPTPASQFIQAGTTKSFVWRYVATTSGNKTVTGRAWASNGSVYSNYAEASVIAHNGSNLTQDIILSPAVVSVGQNFTIQFVVTNTGGSAVTGVVPTAFIKMGSGNYTWVSGPEPATQTVAAGATREFFLVYKAIEAGDIGINAGVKGYNEYSGQIETSPLNSSSNMINAVSPASLVSSIYVPTVVNRGQWFTVTMLVTNNGGAASNSTLPLPLNIDGPAGAIIQIAPSPAAIAPGASAIFTFTYSAAGTGTLSFRGNASGTDENSLASVTSAETSSAIMRINKPASLVMNISKAQIGTVGTGEFIDIVLSVTNTGDTAALDVTPTAIALGGAGFAGYVSGCVPQNVTSLAGGASAFFAWRYSANTAGVVTFSGSMLSANDAISGVPVTVTPSLAAVSVTIVDQASINITALTASPSTISNGQQVTVIMDVRNDGTGDAINVAPSAMTVIGTAGLNPASTPTPAALVTSGGGTASFTWTYNSVSTGTSVFSAKANGTDNAFPFKAITSAPWWSNAVTVQQPANLTASMFLVPSTKATVGQFITVVLAVTNTGGAMAQQAFGVTPVVTSGNGGSALNLTLPASIDIPALGSVNFTWTYSANSTGTVTFISEARGYDFNTKITATAGASVGGLNIQTAPVLSTVITASPAAVGVGSNITVVMSVSNSGQADAGMAVPTGFAVNGASTALYTLLSGPLPVYTTITAGQTVTYTWIYNPTSTGDLIFDGATTATDVNSGETYSSTLATSNTVLVQPNYPVMTSFIRVAPAAVSINQKFTIVMTVSNTGIVAANNVAPVAPPAIGVASAIFTGPAPSTANIPAGGTATFTWVYTAGSTPGSGLVTDTAFTGIYTSTDNSDGVANAITVNAPPLLDGNYMLMSTSPTGFYSVGQVITLTMTISNNGATDAVNVAPQLPLTRVGTGNGIIGSPSPASMSIPSGATGTFTWNVTATTAGVLGYYGRATGQDINTLATYQSVTATSTQATIQSPAHLTAVINIEGTKMNLGQTVQVTMNVTNSGQSPADNVIPTDLLVTADSTGGMIPPIGPLPASHTIAGGATEIFTWVFQATGQGSVKLYGSASGTDHNSTLGVSSVNATSAQVLVQMPAQLSANMWVSPATPPAITTGQQITVYMSVTNTGEADAVAVTPTALAEAGTAVVNPYSSPAPAAVIAGGSTTVFTWVFDTVTSGTKSFNASVDGWDGNEPVQIASNATTSNTVTIADSAYLTAGMSVSQQVVSVGQSITVVLTVTNDGTAQTVNPANVTGTVQLVNVTAGIVPLTLASISGPILVAGEVSFTWTYSATAPGVVTFSSYASYVDIYGSKQTVPQLSPQVQVQAAANLTASISVPSNVNNGQLFTVNMLVNNTGGAGASNVMPVLVSDTVSSTPDITLQNVISAQPIAGGSSANFQFIYLANTNGTLYFSANAAGIDDNSGSVVAAPWTPRANVAIQAPSSLSITAFTNTPPVVTQDQLFTIRMTVSNFGDGGAYNVVPVLFNGAGGTAILRSGPLPVSAPALAGHESMTFTWTYSATGVGNIVYSAGANGRDTNTSLVTTSGPSFAITEGIIAKQAILTSELIVKPAIAGYSQQLTVQLSVTNTGVYPAANVHADTLCWTPPAGADYFTNTVTPVGLFNLAVGQSRVFQWIFTTSNQPGTISFSVKALGVDNPTPGPGVGNIESTNALNTVVISPPPQLYASIDAFPTIVNEGQFITIIMTVTNAGTATAVNVMPSQLYKSGTGFTTPSNPDSPVPSSTSIAAGGEAYFTWITQADNPGAGAVNWTGWATGNDMNNGSPVAATQTASNNVTIEVAATFAAPSISIPAFVTSGQTITVTMTVTNLGTGTLLNAAPNPIGLNITGTGGLVPPSTLPSAVNIAGGTSATFTWLYLAAGTGSVQLLRPADRH